jgi:hypothetical protein
VRRYNSTKKSTIKKDDSGKRQVKWEGKHCNFVFFGRAENVDEAALTFEIAVNKLEWLVQREMSKSEYQKLKKKDPAAFKKKLYSFRTYIAKYWREDQQKEMKEHHARETAEERSHRFKADSRERKIQNKIEKELDLRLRTSSIRGFRGDRSVQSRAQSLARGSSISSKYLK